MSGVDDGATLGSDAHERASGAGAAGTAATTASGGQPASAGADTRIDTRTDTDSTAIGITFKLYATLQDLLPAGTRRNAAPIEVAGDATLHEIIDRFRVPRELAHLVLINGHFQCEADRDRRGVLKEGDVLAIWPPVAGG